MKTNQAVIVGVYDELLSAPEAATVTETLGSYLKTCGYWTFLNLLLNIPQPVVTEHSSKPAVTELLILLNLFTLYVIINI